MLPDKKETLARLRKDIFQLEGYGAVSSSSKGAGHFGLGQLETAFPGGAFPTGVVHEFLCPSREHSAATSGFAAGLLARLLEDGGTCLWISQHPAIFPSGLAGFGVPGGQVIFVHLPRARDVVWATLEALGCQGLCAVITEMSELDFATSRQLQLAASGSGVTGLILLGGEAYRASTCAARWQISPLPSTLKAGMPGVGHPSWRVELLKVRNGRPGAFELSYQAGRFVPLAEDRVPGPQEKAAQPYTRKAG